MCVHVLRNRELYMLVIWLVLVLHWLCLRESVLFYFVWQLKKQSTAILSDSWRNRTLLFCLTAEETEHCYFVWQLKKQNTAVLSDSWSIRTICYFVWQLKTQNTVLFFSSDSWGNRTLCYFVWQLKKQNVAILSDSWSIRTLCYFVWQLKKTEHGAIFSDSWRRRRTALCQHCTVLFDWQLKKKNNSQHCTVLFDWQLKKKNSTLSTLYCSIWLTAEEQQHTVNTVLFYLTDSWRRTTALCQHCNVLFDWQLKKNNSQHCTVLFDWQLKKNNSTLSTLYCSIWLTAEEEQQSTLYCSIWLTAEEEQQHSVNTVLFYLTDSWRTTAAEEQQHSVNTVLFYLTDSWRRTTVNTVLFYLTDSWRRTTVNTVLFYLTDSWRRTTVNTVLFYLTDRWRRRTVNTVLFYLTDSWRTTTHCQHCTVLFDWQLKKKNSTLSTLYCSIWLTAEEEEQHSVNTVLFYLTDSWRRRTALCQHCTVLFDWQLKKKNSTLSTLYCSIWLTAEEEVQHSVNTVLFYLTDSWRRTTVNTVLFYLTDSWRRSTTTHCQHCTVLFDWQLKKKKYSTLSTLYCSIWLTAEEEQQSTLYCSIWLTAEEEVQQHTVNTVLFYLTDSWRRRRSTALCQHCTVLFDWQLKKNNSQHCTVLFDWQLKKKYNNTLSTLYCSIWLTAEEEEVQHSVNTVPFYLTDSWRSRTATCRRAMGSWWPPTRSCGSGWVRWSGRWGSCNRSCRPRNTRWTTCTGPRNTWRTTCSAWRSVRLLRPCSSFVCWFAGLQKYTQ